MLLSQLKQIIREGVNEILNEKKKNILKVSEKPDPLHHLQGSKKIKTTTSKNNNKKKIQDTGDCCEPDEKKVQKRQKSKVFHEKSDEFQHEALEDFDFNKKSKNESKKSGIESALFEEEMTDMPDIEDLNVDDDI